MSAPTGPTDGTPSAAPTGEPQGTNAPADTGATAQSGDYLNRIASDAEFAKSEVRKHQGQATKVEEQIRVENSWKGQLAAYQQQGITGDDIAKHLTDYTSLLSHPKMRGMIEQFQKTGDVTASASNGNGDPAMTTTDDDDFLMSDEQKEIRALRGELDKFRQTIDQQGTSLGQTALKGHLETVASEMNITGDKLEAVKGKLIEQVKQWQSQGAAGDAALARLQSTEGEQVVRTLVMHTFDWKDVLGIAKEQILRNDDVRRQLGTEGLPDTTPPGVGGEPAPQFDSAIEALQAVRGRPELADNTRA